MFRVLIILAIFMSCSCRSYVKDGYDSRDDKKQRTIEAVSFVYDIDCIPLQKMVRADTLWRTTAAHSTASEEPFLAYVATGDCSFCIADAFDFIHTYHTMTSKKKFKLLLLRGGKEVFRYYMEKEGVTSLLQNVEIISISPEIHAPDGVYLIYCGKIINYAPWND